MSDTIGTLRRIVYVSRVAPGIAEPRQEMLDHILASARRNNARRGVTGALLFSRRRFAQVLEGPPRAVEEVFETIQLDMRHDHIAVLQVVTPVVRAFADWSMAFAEAPGLRPEELDDPAMAQRLVGLLQAAIRNTEVAVA
jgi:hypothetical protein